MNIRDSETKLIEINSHRLGPQKEYGAKKGEKATRFESFHKILITN